MSQLSAHDRLLQERLRNCLPPAISETKRLCPPGSARLVHTTLEAVKAADRLVPESGKGAIKKAAVMQEAREMSEHDHGKPDVVAAVLEMVSVFIDSAVHARKAAAAESNNGVQQQSTPTPGGCLAKLRSLLCRPNRQ